MAILFTRSPTHSLAKSYLDRVRKIERERDEERERERGPAQTTSQFEFSTKTKIAAVCVEHSICRGQ